MQMIKKLSKFSLSSQQKVSLTVLLIYWPFIFILTHIIVPSSLLQQMRAYDKALHFLVYFILIILLWFSVSPIQKANLRRKTIWTVLLLLVFYAGADEWLQGLSAGRTRDIMDFAANLAGLMGGLVLICFFSFWPAVLVASAAAIVVFTNAIRIQFTGQLAFVRPLFLLSSFGFFTFTWLRFLSLFSSIQHSRLKWLIFSTAVPLVFMLVVKFLSQITGRAFELIDITLSSAAIFAVVVTAYLTSLFDTKHKN